MAYGRTDSIFRYPGAAPIGTTKSIPHSDLAGGEAAVYVSIRRALRAPLWFGFPTSCCSSRDWGLT